MQFCGHSRRPAPSSRNGIGVAWQISVEAMFKLITEQQIRPQARVRELAGVKFSQGIGGRNMKMRISEMWRSGRAFLSGLACALGFMAGGLPAFAQIMLSGHGTQVHPVGSDLAVLTSQDERKEINCSVTPAKPILGFDLRFHAGFDVQIPLKDLAGSENFLTILFRVTPADTSQEPAYFIQRYNVPEVSEDASGDALLAGTIDIGEGNYHVDWMMRDHEQRVCSHFWDMEAALPSRDREMKLELPPSTITATLTEQFTPESPTTRVLDKAPLRIKVLVNFAPQNALAATMRPQDTSALVSILRRFAREPQFGKFSVVAFNIQEQRVLYRQDEVDQIDFPALGDALREIKLGTVDVAKLQNKHGDTEFLTELIQTEMGGATHPDALIFAGPKVMLDANVSEDTLKPLADVDYPVFYMNYTLNPQAMPWRDSIGRAVRVFRGTEFTITRPRDLWFSVTEVISRIVKLNYARNGNALVKSSQ